MVRLLSTINHLTHEAFSDPLRRFQLSVGTLAFLVLFGTVVYMLIEDWNFFDSLYMTVITIATVGFSEVRPLSQSGQAFTIVLILLGVGAATTAITNAVSLAVGPLLWESLEARRIKRVLNNIKDHYVVCGYGRMGRQIIKDLQARDEPFVLVDVKTDMQSTYSDLGFPYVMGDATRDEVLQEAGIARAKGFVAALNDDPQNIMAVLTARELNPEVFVVARVVIAESESKLYRAGADRVINPYQIGGHRIALTLLRPAVHDFLDHIFHFGEIGREIDIGQIIVHKDTRLAGQSIMDSDLRREHNVNILALRNNNGEMVITPAPQTRLEAGYTLIVIGPPEAIYELERQNMAEA